MDPAPIGVCFAVRDHNGKVPHHETDKCKSWRLVRDECEHGGLRRSCDRCELISENAALRDEIERLKCVGQASAECPICGESTPHTHPDARRCKVEGCGRWAELAESVRGPLGMSDWCVDHRLTRCDKWCTGTCGGPRVYGHHGLMQTRCCDQWVCHNLLHRRAALAGKGGGNG